MASRMFASGPAAETTRGVATGNIGDGYGPYAYAQQQVPPMARGPRPQPGNRLQRKPVQSQPPPVTPGLAAPQRISAALRLPSTNAVPAFDSKERDSQETAVAEQDPEWDAIPDDSFTLFSLRGWINMSSLAIILVGIVVLFAGYPIISHFTNPPPQIVTINLANSTTSV